MSFLAVNGEWHYLWRAIDQEGISSISWDNVAEISR
jgi:hypothetical protein